MSNTRKDQDERVRQINKMYKKERYYDPKLCPTCLGTGKYRNVHDRFVDCPDCVDGIYDE